MKDLCIWVADAETGAFLKALLGRPRALNIREIECDFERHTGRDSGMVTNGPELTRQMKRFYRKTLLVLDYHGCGRENRQPAKQVAEEMQGRLDVVTWQGKSSVVIVEPELERWLWLCESAIAKHFSISAEELRQSCRAYADKQGKSLDQIKEKEPKTLLDHICRHHHPRHFGPDNFENIGQHASIKQLQASPSFQRFHQAMQSWFPRPPR